MNDEDPVPATRLARHATERRGGADDLPVVESEASRPERSVGSVG
jgi:hypothetical protein